MNAMEQVKTCTYTMTMDERIFGKYNQGRHHVKVKVSPLKVYVYSLAPDEGVEVLYLAGENSGKALVNPNKFPYINVNLSPHHKLFRQNHIYTIEQMGFAYLHSILKKYELKEKEKFFSNLTVVDDSMLSKKNYYVLEINNKDFGLQTYKVQKGETLTSIAKKFNINDHMILELNKECKYYDDVKPGQTITIPNSFARKIVFHIDKKNLLPLTQYIYDHKGLFSKVVFNSFVLNPVFSPDEFSRNNPKYKF